MDENCNMLRAGEEDSLFIVQNLDVGTFRINLCFLKPSTLDLYLHCRSHEEGGYFHKC